MQALKQEWTGATTLEQLVPILRCPRTGASLSLGSGTLESARGGHSYSIIDRVPDLMCPPDRFRIDLPWYEPWADLDALELERPAPVQADDLPYHLDAHLASVPGDSGNNRLVLEIGCGERKCEPYFLSRGFRYVGSDVDRRGPGPHLMADAHNLPFVDESIDVYLSLAVYEHLVSPIVAASEAMRVLKPGGIFFGTAAFVYGFHDRASFNHMTHGGLLVMMRSVGFERVRMWPDWLYSESIPEMAFGRIGRGGLPWQLATKAFLKAMDVSYTRTSNLARRLTKKRALNLQAREVQTAGSISFVAAKPA